jgi:dolichyl-phosphate beta-glucosyltransferase
LQQIPNLSIIIPAFNEEKRIRATLDEIDTFFSERQLTVEVIVSDDGSSDNTSEIVRNFKPSCFDLDLIRFQENRGKAAALREGVLNAKGSLILICDADLSTPVSELDKLLPYIQSGEFSIAIASRALKDSTVEVHQPLYRELLGKSFNLLAQILAVPGIWDTQCGFKLFASDVGKILFSKMTVNDFAYDVEILTIAQENGYKIIEVPIKWINSPETKLKVLKDVPLMFLSLWRIFFNKINGKYVK